MNCRLLSFTTVFLLVVAGIAPRAVAGPPLVCHPLDIGAAQSLPWAGGPDWHSPSRSYDTARLVSDTLALLDGKAPTIVRMETLRRAAIYSSKQPRLAYELLSKLMGRALSAEVDGKDAALAWFDAGYLVETYRQAGWIQKPGLIIEIDGYSWTLKAIQLSGGSADMEFAASLMKGGKWPNQHFTKALTTASKGSLLARNLEKYKD